MGGIDLASLKSTLQAHLSDGLVVVVGSGLSCAEGMPGMKDLAAFLGEKIPEQLSQSDLQAWKIISPQITKLGLEAALLATPPSASLEARIMAVTVDLMLPAEQRIISEVVAGNRTLSFSRLLRHLLKPAEGVQVVTTNYDRLVEVSAEAEGLGVDTMFLGSHLGQLKEKEARLSFIRDVQLKGRTVRYLYRDRVRVYKPHGSLDWYHQVGKPIRYEGDLPLPRLVITPGLNKFRNGYESPFDCHRDRANAAIDQAHRILIIGYGFNDDHLETHLKPRVLSGLPTVLIARGISPNAAKLISKSENFTALAFSSRDGQDGTDVVTKNGRYFFPAIKLWDLHSFIDEVLEP